MYVDILRKEYLPAVAELEKKSYPEELVLGLQSFEEDYRKYTLRSFSHCIFEKGELVCYIVAYRVGVMSEECPVYISDINCPNPRYLKRLLLNFFYAAKRSGSSIFRAEMRENSYRLLLNREKRHDNVVQILEQKESPEYYLNGETAHCVTFKIDVDEYLRDDWKSKFQLKLDDTCLSEDINIFRTAFQYLKEPANAGIDFYEKKNMEFVIGSIKELIIGYYQMFGERIPADLQYYLYERNSARNENAFSKTITTLESYGYRENKGENYYRHDYYRGILTVNRKIEIYNTKYKNDLSGFRWLRRKNIQYLNSNGKSRWVICFDRYGVSRCLMKVPYLSQRQYSYYLRRLLFLMEIEQQVLGTVEEQFCFQDIVKNVYSLLSSKDAEDCIRNIVGRYVVSENYYHDWLLVACNIRSSHEILTKGAVKAVFMKSYNYALQVSRNINALRQIVLTSSFARNIFDIKKVRKEFSYLIRKNKNSDEYVKGLSQTMTAKYSKKLSMPLSEKKLLDDFIERMRKYSPAVTVYSVYQTFGAECLGKFLKGTYPCVFKAGEIVQSFSALTEFLSRLLKSRTRQAKHIYQALRKQELLSDILKGSISVIQYHAILKILTYHNVEFSNTVINKLHEFRTVVEKKGSPEFLVAGDASVCCMSFGSAKAVDYATEEGFGIINVYYRERIIANSLIWINEPYQCLVLDNIEVHPNYMKYEEELKICFQNAAVQIMQEQSLRCAVQGMNYNDLWLYDKEMPLIYFDKIKPFKVGLQRFYSDAGRSVVIAGHFPDNDRHLTYGEWLENAA